jgi:hypothetical protein
MDEGSASKQAREELLSSVWMMHSGVGTEGLHGTLTLESEALVFRPKESGRGPERFPLSRIRRVRATFATPVLELRLERGFVPRIIGFYFVPPPSWEPPERDLYKGFWGSASRITTKRKARKAAAAQLLTASVDKRDAVKSWVQAVRQAKKGGLTGI